MAMKVGIITLSASNNCGSLLQAYALQKIIEMRYNHRVEVINFSSKKSREMYSLSIKSLIKTLVYGHTHLFRNLYLQVRHIKDYDIFRMENLHLTKKYLSCKALSAGNCDYDMVICGSDQVWNIEMSDFDMAFFLTWVKDAKKAAYAPSFGSLDLCKYRYVIHNSLKDFYAISTRDDTNHKNLEIITNKTVSSCADPTLLLESDTWSDFTGEPFIQGNYIFYYSWSYNSIALNRFVSEQAKGLGWPVYVIDARKWYSGKYSDYGFVLPAEGGPKIFLKLMKYAKLVFVESFHGVIFSYIFRRNFWLLDANDSQSLDLRLNGILTQLGLKQRLLRPSLYTPDVLEEINYASIDTGSLKEIQNNSFKYLDTVLLSGD